MFALLVTQRMRRHVLPEAAVEVAVTAVQAALLYNLFLSQLAVVVPRLEAVVAAVVEAELPPVMDPLSPLVSSLFKVSMVESALPPVMLVAPTPVPL